MYGVCAVRFVWCSCPGPYCRFDYTAALLLAELAEVAEVLVGQRTYTQPAQFVRAAAKVRQHTHHLSRGDRRIER